MRALDTTSCQDKPDLQTGLPLLDDFGAPRSITGAGFFDCLWSCAKGTSVRCKKTRTGLDTNRIVLSCLLCKENHLSKSESKKESDSVPCCRVDWGSKDSGSGSTYAAQELCGWGCPVVLGSSWAAVAECLFQGLMAGWLHSCEMWEFPEGKLDTTMSS